MTDDLAAAIARARADLRALDAPVQPVAYSLGLKRLWKSLCALRKAIGEAC